MRSSLPARYEVTPATMAPWASVRNEFHTTVNLVRAALFGGLVVGLVVALTGKVSLDVPRARSA